MECGKQGQDHLLVVEYKGCDRLDGGDATEKARIGERWAATSKNRRCIFVQVNKADPLKRSLDKQLKDAISGIEIVTDEHSSFPV